MQHYILFLTSIDAVAGHIARIVKKSKNLFDFPYDGSDVCNFTLAEDICSMISVKLHDAALP